MKSVKARDKSTLNMKPNSMFVLIVKMPENGDCLVEALNGGF